MDEKAMMLQNILNEDRLKITYRPSWREVTGSVTSAILLQQMRFRWVNHGCKPFYKFVLPPKSENSKYKPGDSWVEELGFTRKEYYGAFGKIGRALSKEDLADLDKALDGVFVGTFTDQQHVTWFYFNETYFIARMTEHYAGSPRPEKGHGKSPRPEKGHGGDPKGATDSVAQKGPPIHAENHRPHANNTTTAAEAGEIFKLYQNEISPLSSLIADKIKAAIIDVEQKLGNLPPGGQTETALSWFEYAFSEAVSANVRRWNYVETILEGIIKSGSLAAHKLKRGENGQARNSQGKRTVNGKAAGTGHRQKTKSAGDRNGQAGLSKADAFQRKQLANFFGSAFGGQD